MLHHAAMTVFRTIAGEERWKYSKLTDGQVLTKLDSPTQTSLIKLKQFRLFTSLITRRV